MQPEALADAVVVLVKNALGPITERLAAAEARLAVLGDLRDRVVTVEAKAAQPVVLPVVEPPSPADLGPILERVAASEARLSILGDLRDRVVTIETKAAQPPQVVPVSEPVASVDVSPMLERLAATEARLSVLGDLRDRVVAVEVKAAQPAISAPVELPSPVDLSPVLERVAAAEARLATLGDLRDRVVVVETKTAIPSVSDAFLEALRTQIAALEVREPVPPLSVAEAILTPLRERILRLESKAELWPGLAEVAEIEQRVNVLQDRVAGQPAPEDVSAVRDRLVALETKWAGPSTADTALVDLKDRIVTIERRLSDDVLTKEVSTLRERVGVMEVRAQLPGPPGINGTNGKDGADGFGLEDFSVGFDGNRTLALTFARGDLKKIFPVVLPYQRNQGVFTEGKSYTAGDVVTWAGSSWHANEDTTAKPGEGSKAWTLIVKRGRDGRDLRGEDMKTQTLPVVSVGGRHG